MAARYLSYAVAALFLTSAGSVSAQAPPIPPQPAAPAAAVPAVPAPAAAAAPGAPALGQGQGDMQVLEEGPVHEAFAEPIALDAQPRVVTDRAPPEPINEVPPDVRPDGDNVEWIPGYWMWSGVQQDFVWVSGVWRDIPPGRRWVPGHWMKAAGGFEWVSGFWAGLQAQEVQLLPHPPASLELGPSSPAPGDNFFWVPGCWVWQNNAYAWRAGYWFLGQADWVWVPDHYCYTPGGSIFVGGYWDYPLVNRGLLFAPVWWPNHVYGYAGWRYRPYSVVNTSLLLASLFIHDRYHHYYFGRGHWGGDHFHPWWEHGHRGRGHGYDPLWAYHRWHDGHNRDGWEDNWRRDFDRRHDGHQRGPDRGLGRPNGEQVAGGPGHLVRHLDDVMRDDRPQMHLKRMDAAEAQKTQRQLANWTELRDARAKFESRTAVADGGGRISIGAAAGGRVQVGDRPNGGRPIAGRPGQFPQGGGQQAGNAGQVGGAGQGNVAVDAGAGNAAGQVAAGGQSRVRVQSPGQGGSPFEARRSTFKLPDSERTTTRGAVSNEAAVRGQTRGPYSGGRWSSSGGNVIVPGAQSGSQQQVDASNMGRPSWQGGRPSAQQGGGATGAAPSGTGNPNWLYRGGSGSSQFRSQLPQSGTPGAQGAVQIPRSGGASSFYRGGGQPSFQGSGQPSQPSGAAPSYRGNFSGGGQPSYSRSFNGGGQSSFRGNSGSSPQIYRGNSGSSPQIYRGNSGGGGDHSSFRSNSGGGQSMFRGGGGGGGSFNRGSFGGDGGHGRGRSGDHD